MAEADSTAHRMGEVGSGSPRSTHSMEDGGVGDSLNLSEQVTAVGSGSDHDSDGEGSRQGSEMEGVEEEGDHMATGFLTPSEGSSGMWAVIVLEEAARAAAREQQDAPSDADDSASQHSNASEQENRSKERKCS
jgi:hypothetical protein